MCKGLGGACPCSIDTDEDAGLRLPEVVDVEGIPDEDPVDYGWKQFPDEHWFGESPEDVPTGFDVETPTPEPTPEPVSETQEIPKTTFPPNRTIWTPRGAQDLPERVLSTQPNTIVVVASSTPPVGMPLYAPHESDPKPDPPRPSNAQDDHEPAQMSVWASAGIGFLIGSVIFLLVLLVVLL